MFKLFKRAVFLIPLLLVAGCTKEPYTVYEGIAMTMSYKVIIGDPTSKKMLPLIASQIDDVFDLTNKKFNNWNPDSEISKINRSPAGKKITVSKELFELLEYTESVFQFTDGLFDPTILPLKDLWISKLKCGFIPSQEEIDSLNMVIGFDKIILDRIYGTISKQNEHTKLDLCGISKGYTVDLIVESLYKLNIHNYYVEWGGEIRTSGKHPSGRSWQVIPIKTLEQPIEILEMAIASSGSYLQNWTVNGITYTHIIHPKTKRPLTIKKNSIQATTVIHEKCRDADALATTLMLFDSVDEARSWADKNGLIAYVKESDSSY